MSDTNNRRDELAEAYASACIPFAHDNWRIFYLAYRAGWDACLAEIVKDMADLEHAVTEKLNE